MADEHITFFSKMAFGKPVGRCIYCGSTENLSDEHIIAYCLGVDAYLRDASCEICAKETSYLEGYAGRQIFGPLRIHFGIQSRRKRIELPPVSVVFHTAHGEDIRNIPREELPPLLVLPILEQPGIFAERTPASLGATTPWVWIADNPDERMKKFQKPGDLRWEIKFQDKPIVFVRMLAKIAHALAVARLGLDSFRPYLPPLVLGDDSRAGWMVGAAAPPTKPLPAFTTPAGQFTTHHNLSLTVMGSPGRPDVVVTTIRLFLHIGTPTYYVIVGEALPAAITELATRDDEQAR